MKNSQIKTLSKEILGESGKESRILMLLIILNLLFFSLLPCGTNLLANKFFNNFGTVISAAVTVAALIIYLFTYSSFAAGSCAWFNFYGKKNRAAKAAYWFKLSKSALSARLFILLFLKKFFWYLTFLFPGAAVIISSVILAMNGGIELNFFACTVAGGAVMLLLGLVFCFIVLQKYFLAPYIMAADPSLNAREAIRLSRLASNGRMKKTAAFKLSFIPWFLSCVAVFPVFYVWPYYKQSCAVYAKQIPIPQGVL